MRFVACWVGYTEPEIVSIESIYVYLMYKINFYKQGFFKLEQLRLLLLLWKPFTVSLVTRSKNIVKVSPKQRRLTALGGREYFCITTWLRSEPYFIRGLFQKTHCELACKYAALFVVVAVGLNGENSAKHFSFWGGRERKMRGNL